MNWVRNLIGWLNRLIQSGEIRKWTILGILIGIIAGVGSLAIYYSFEFFSFLLIQSLAHQTIPVPGSNYGNGNFVLPAFHTVPSAAELLIPVSTTLGGLISGFLVYRFAPETEGHGTDAVIDAFHNKGGKIRRRVPIVKLLTSAITIGSGGSAGREGPTAQIAAGFGSFVSDVFHLSERDRRLAMAAGIGAGIGSIFSAPLGGALLSTEILYRRDFETEALVPSLIASVTGYAIFGYFFNYQPLFTIPAGITLGFYHPTSIAVYLIVGIVAGLVGIGFVNSFYAISGIFKKMNRVSKYLRPAIGGLLVGIIAMYFPEVMGLGYGWVQVLFYNPYFFPLWLILALVIAKIVATSLTIGSGGSGGVFAPGMVIGAFLGGAMGLILNPYFPQLTILEITIVTMIAFFGGISKAPISVIIMGTEMTQSYALFLPLMIATLTAYFVSGKHGIYRSQVDNRSDSPAHYEEYRQNLRKRKHEYF